MTLVLLVPCIVPFELQEHLLFPISNCNEGFEFQLACNRRPLHQKQLVPPIPLTWIKEVKKA